ncbi:MAG: sulfatase-like hydrolase/transferase [Candidatus Celaenobacter polaris]|nr:sulfatase-like hydrolase/transferase [Candidatus Celaenobacter polaris]
MKAISKKIYYSCPEVVQEFIGPLMSIYNKAKRSDLNPSYFPKKSNFTSYIDEPLIFSNEKKRYFTKPYREEEYLLICDDTLMVEILPGNEISTSKSEIISVDESSLIPVSFKFEGTAIIERKNDKEVSLSGFQPNRYYYFTLHPGEKLVINSDQNKIICDPIPLEKKSNRDIKFILCIFVDGLSNNWDNKDKLRNLMPNTYKYFSEGVIFKNCYVNGEWSLPSLANIFTGQYTHLHKIFHPEKNCEVSVDKEILSEYFQKKDYLTFHVGANWRKSPAYGYVKGFDRTVYKKDMECFDVISNLLEQLFAFENRDQFGWIDLFDLHRTGYSSNVPDLSCQAHYSQNAQSYHEKYKKKSVFNNYDPRKIERYTNQISRLDKYLKLIYDHIESNYTDNEVLVMLCSDHGQSYLSPNNNPLSDSRIKVPFMIRGKGVPKNIESYELIENVDIFPTMLKLSEIEFNEETISGQLPKILGGKEERKLVYSESIYPGQTFKATIRDGTYQFYFETEHPTTDDGMIVLGLYKTTLISEDNGSEITNEDDLVIQYTTQVLKNIETNNLDVQNI